MQSANTESEGGKEEKAAGWQRFLLFTYLICTMIEPDCVNLLLQRSWEECTSHTRALSRDTSVEQFPRRNQGEGVRQTKTTDAHYTVECSIDI